MMKRKGKVLSLVLAAILTVSSGSVVQAADTSTKVQNTHAVKAESQNLESQIGIAEGLKTAKVNMNAIAKEARSSNDAIGDVPYTYAKTGLEKKAKGAVIIGSTAGNIGVKYMYSKAVDLPAKGSFLFDAIYTAKINQDRTINFGLYSDKDLKNPVGSGSVSIRNTESKQVIYVPKAGRYYIGVYANVYSDDGDEAWQITTGAAYINGADRTLTSGKQIAVGQKKYNDQINYFKFKATQTGYITAMADSDSGYAKVVLCNSKKKAYSGSTYAKYIPAYGVTKGKTYYIKVTNSGDSKGYYCFRIDNKKISEKSGKTKSKAVNVKKNKTVNGTIQAGSSKADWYKIKLTKKQKLNVYISGRTNNTLKIKLYAGKNSRSYSLNNSYDGKGFSYKIYTYNKLPKGTYYVQISRGNSKSSGVYSLKWK